MSSYLIRNVSFVSGPNDNADCSRVARIETYIAHKANEFLSHDPPLPLRAYVRFCTRRFMFYCNCGRYLLDALVSKRSPSNLSRDCCATHPRRVLLRASNLRAALSIFHVCIIRYDRECSKCMYLPSYLPLRRQ